VSRYRKLSDYLRGKYGTRVHRLPINAGFTCPNRDGTISKGGCIFCEETGSGFGAMGEDVPISQQVRVMMERAVRRYKAEKFIAYFQAFSNTYAPLDVLRKKYESALVDDRIVALSVSTRPDLLQEEILDLLEEFKEKVDVMVEVGFQTSNYRTLMKINRGHTLAEFIDAVIRLKKREFEVVAHVILNLPWDDMIDVVESAKILSALKIDGVKCHSLYIVDGTPLGEMFKRGEIEICSLEEYVERVVRFLEYLDPRIVIHRLVADPPKDKVLFGNWGLDKRKILWMIEKELEQRDTYQGARFNYLRRKGVDWFGKGKGIDGGSDQTRL